MKMKFTFLAVAAFFAGSSVLRAQSDNTTYLHCGTNEAMAKVFAEHPDLKAQFETADSLAGIQDAMDFQHGYSNSTERNSNGNSTQSNPTYIIPVVFHIIHDYGSENISNAQVFDEMKILNNDYRKLNADTTAIRPAFTSIAADTKIEFRLANKDPNGNCTNGIDRVYSTETYIGDDGSKLDDWPRNKYLNIWVVKTISNGAAGYAYLPAGVPSASVDGVLILSSYIGSIGTGNVATSRALTHEIGHCLNLEHPWGNTNSPGVSCGDDGVSDTPITKGWTSCASSSASEVCTPNVEENVQNYMDYSYCSCMFTAGQKTRMTNALNNSNNTTGAQRNQLWAAANLTATGVSISGNPVVCAPNADFTPTTLMMVCPGGSLTFQNASWNGNPTSWSWSFPGGTPSTSTDSIPTIQYSTSGTYNVSLTVSNASGSNSITRNGLVLVSPATAQYSTANYSEGMENATTFANDWMIVNPQGNAWQRTTTAAATGTASVRILNSTSAIGQVDAMISPSLDMTAFTSPTFTFKVAYAQQVSTDLDKLTVYVSTDCGRTWSQRYVKTGTTLSTAPASASNFVPTSAQWRMETISLASYLTDTDVRIKFAFTSAGGNNIYLDDININSPAGINSPEMGINQFNVFPNPAQDNTIVSFSNDKSQKVNIQVFDMTGREVMDLYNGNLDAGEHQFPIHAEGTLGSGLYFVRLTNSDGRSVTRKLVVE